MAIKIDRALAKEDIRIGFATIKATVTSSGVVWTLPGGKKTLDPKEAKKHAERVDALIRRNLKLTQRTLI